ncbi:acyltransferase [Pedobacter miscanthi]|uniref:Acyltransferase n=1 Tax=Pedobacter miscanthi TaxID=2259170 RepID=A0A366KPV9_9SPHI|nr:acyltransferase [Pedobacter miscanthi]RBQ03558.1 acyltransferase [Pedobacter miscanthi]
MDQPLINQRKITFNQKFKSKILKLRFKDKLITDGAIRILGKLPVFKLPGKSKIIIGKKVVLNSDSVNSNTALTYNCTLVCGLQGTIEIGDNSMLNGVSITAYKRVKIGKNCQIASCTLISDTDFHPVNPSIRLMESMGYKIDHTVVNKEEVLIGNNVWIGWGSTILKGVNIGDNSIIAAGSVVVNDIPSNVIAAGNPAKVKRSI